MNVPGLPPKQGLYDPQHEKDSCGVGFVVDIKGQRSHQIVQQGLPGFRKPDPSRCAGCDPCTGDGAGILLQVPHEFFKRAAKDSGIAPRSGRVWRRNGVLTADADARAQCETVFYPGH